MSRKRVTIHRRRICAMGAGVLLLLSGWLPIATASPPDAPPGTAFADSCPLRRIGTQTGSLRQPDRLWSAGSELDSRTDQQRWITSASRLITLNS
jgi:hypothetical protein